MIFEFFGMLSDYAWLAENAFARSGAVVILIGIAAALNRVGAELDPMLKQEVLDNAELERALEVLEKQYATEEQLFVTKAVPPHIAKRASRVNRYEQLALIRTKVANLSRRSKEWQVKTAVLQREFFQTEGAILFAGTLVWGFGDLLFRCGVCRF